MPQKIESEDLLKEMDDIKNLMSQLEEEYRKANVSEKYYQELKGKFSQRLEEIEKKVSLEEGEVPKEEKVVEEAVKEEKPEKVEGKEINEESVEEEVSEKLEKSEEKKVKATEKEIIPEKIIEKKEEKIEETEEKVEKKKEKKEKVDIPKVEEVVKEEKPKTSILGRLLGKKEKIPEAKPKEIEPEKVEKEEKPEEKKELEVGEIGEMTPEVIEKLAQQVAEESGVTKAGTELGEVKEEIPEEQPEAAKDIEIEKLKVMIDAVRDAKRATDETIQTLSESIGEIRSMVFQADASLRENAVKLEKIEDDISEIKPKEIDKKFREIGDTLEKYQMLIEKFEKKSEDLAGKVNNVYEMLKGIGGIENLISLNKEIQQKIEDVKEALKYTERIAFKTEKVFIDLSKNLEDFIVYKTRQDSLDETVKDLIKFADGMNLKFENFPTKKDLEIFRGDILVLQKQIEEINKILPVVQAKLPETITNLRKEKDDILLFLDVLNQQLRAGKISIGEYEIAKKKNLDTLAKVEGEIREEWEKLKEVIEKGEVPKEEKVVEEAVKEEKPEKVEKKIEKKEKRKEKKKVVLKKESKKLERKKRKERPSGTKPREIEPKEVEPEKVEKEEKVVEEKIPEAKPLEKEQEKPEKVDIPKVEEVVKEEKPKESGIQGMIEERTKSVELPKETFWAKLKKAFGLGF